MLILHASEDDGYLHLWGETPPGPERAHPAFSPFDAGEEALAAALAPFVAGPCAGLSWQVAAFLPTGADGPLPSTPLLAAPGGTGSASRLAPWAVTTFALGTAEMAALLDACAGNEEIAPAVRVGPSVAYWARVFRFALALVARQQVIPAVTREGEDWFARWKPVFVGEDAARFAALADGMPAACRALDTAWSPDRDAAPTMPRTPPALALERVLTRLADFLMRPPPPSGGAAGSKVRHAFDSPHDQWLHALQTPDEGRLTGAEREWDDLRRAALDWQRPLSVSLAAPFRLCFRLEEPEAAERPDAPWRVRFLLQSVADPSLLLPPAAAWNPRGGRGESGGDAARLLAVPGFKPREFLFAALAEAARICPEIGASLKAAAPEGYTLSLSGAHTFLTERAYLLEQAGFVVLLPAWWTRRGRPKITGSVTAKSPKMQGSGGLSLDSIIAFDYEVALDGQTISLAELERLARQKQPLVRLRGQWVQLDADEIARAVAFWKKKDGKTVALRDLIRMQLGASSGPGGIEIGDLRGEGAVGEILDRLTDAAAIAPLPTPAGFTGTLRPYQERGYAWLRFLTDLGLGACLADDMGLGKSAQTIALLLDSRRREDGDGEKKRRPALIVCPTSVLGNWQRELARFAPSLSVLAHHGPGRLRDDALLEAVQGHDVLLTSYALLTRDAATLQRVSFVGLTLDEAQNVKNPETKQSKAARSLSADWRVALSGTPVENHVGDLWAIFEFLNPGLLGSERAFKREFFTPIQVEQDEEAAARLKRRTGPLILRRLKTDRSVIADLPDKVEMEEFCPLTPEQASLYEAVLRDFEGRMEEADDADSSDPMARRGLVLATLTRLKQVCNHPAQFLADGSPLPGRSGKLARLTELAEELAETGDKCLVFTQFAAMGEMLQTHLRERLGREVLFLHGGVAKKDRDRMVERFQTEPRIPLFLLSLKAGGVGLNLTAASRVIHFDRWWNPAVEDQATDRAFRIGQVKNVLVRKFVCQGTVEERIAEMIGRKRDIAGRVVGTGEQWLTELSTRDLRNLFALSREQAVEEM